MLFEAFESNALSKMMKFLKSKVDNNSKERFRDKLKTMISQLDIPIDKIKDDNIKYLNRNQALKIKSTEEDERGLYCLKFWFSIDEGYLGFTGTGGLKMDFNYYIRNINRRSYRDEQNEPFNDRDLDYIKNSLGIKTGKLTPVKNYDDLQHGQLVVGFWSEDDEDLDRLSLAKIWRDEYGHLNAIQNVASGGSPDRDVNGVNWREWRNEDSKFRDSWSLGDVNSPSSDHGKIHIYTPSDEPITVVGKKEEKKEDDGSSPFDFNLPVNRNYNLREWGETDWSIYDYKSVEKSDFAIVLMIGDVLKSVGTKVSDVRKSREESKEGATRLLSDSEIKKANIERYMAALVARMGIKQDITELKNLQRLIIKAVCGDFSFISVYKERPGFGNLDSISHNIYEMMKADESDKHYYLSNIVENFKSLNSYSEDYTKQYIKSLKIVNNSNNEVVKEIFKIFIEIGKKIKNYLLSQNIETIEDLSMVVVKLKSIRNLANERGLSFSYIRNVLNEFHYSNDTEYYIDRIDKRREEEILEDIKKAKHIERYVDSLLR
jgi:hypothetical protein